MLTLDGICFWFAKLVGRDRVDGAMGLRERDLLALGQPASSGAVGFKQQWHISQCRAVEKVGKPDIQIAKPKICISLFVLQLNTAANFRCLWWFPYAQCRTVMMQFASCKQPNLLD